MGHELRFLVEPLGHLLPCMPTETKHTFLGGTFLLLSQHLQDKTVAWYDISIGPFENQNWPTLAKQHSNMA